MKARLLRMGVLALLFGAAGSLAARADCGLAPEQNRAVAQGLCVSFSIYGEAAASEHPVLFVALHGDLTSGGPADYQHRIARRLVGPGVVAVGLVRPGYADSEGRRSGGVKGPDTYTARNIDAVADVIAALRKRFDARRVVALGHSGGAIHLGVIIGRRPGLIDSAILISSVDDIPRWRQMRGGRPWPNSLSPRDYANAVPTSTRVFAINGENDSNAVPALAQDYIAMLRTRGVTASFELAAGTGHDYTGLLSRMAEERALAEIR